MSVEQTTATGADDARTGTVHDVTDLTAEGVQAFARSAVDGTVHVERKGDRTLLVVE